jgi:hypothetical protein
MTRGFGRGAVLFAPWLLLLGLPHAAWAACSVTQGDFDGNGREDVRILGDAGKQRITILDGQATYRVKVDCNADGDTADPGDIDTGTLAFDIETFDVQGRGQDVVTYQNTGVFNGASKNILVTFGPGTPANPNVVQLSTGALIQANSNVVLDVLGSAGPDRLFVITSHAITNSSIVVRGDLGAGDDFVGLTTLTPLTGAVMTTDLDLGLGNNVFSVAPQSDVDNSTVLTNVVGSSSPLQVDTFTWTAYGRVANAGRYLTTLSTLAGNDKLRAVVVPGVFNISGSNSIVALRARGGPGNDAFSFNDGYGAPGVANAGLLDIDFSGGAGNDVATVDWSSALNGNGTTRWRVNGGDGDDFLIGAINLDSSGSTPNLDFLLQGGRGNDTLYWSVLDDGAHATYRQLGTSLVDGGADTDTCIFFGNGRHESLNCESGS